MIKCTGQEWREFCAALPDCIWFDYCDAPESFTDTDALKFEGGEACWQSGTLREVPGVLSAKELEALRDRQAGFSVETLFRRWKTAQTMATVLVQIAKADMEKFGMFAHSSIASRGPFAARRGSVRSSWSQEHYPHMQYQHGKYC